MKLSIPNHLIASALRKLWDILYDTCHALHFRIPSPLAAQHGVKPYNLIKVGRVNNRRY
jgi:hypothetical protein